MKKALLLIILIAGPLSTHAQGLIFFGDRQSDVTIHVYAPQLANPSVEITGNANSAVGVTSDIYDYNGIDANVFNTAPNTTTMGGPTIYTGGAIGNTNIANPTAAGGFNYNNGSDYTIELFAAPGFNAPASALAPVSQYTSIFFTSSSFGGAFKNLTFVPEDPGMPFSNPDATVSLLVWYNDGVEPFGLPQSSLSAQLAAAQVGGMPWGQSLPFNLLANGGLGLPPAALPNLEGAQSFSLIIIPLPEPNTLTVVLLGAAIVLFSGSGEKFIRQRILSTAPKFLLCLPCQNSKPQ